MMQMLSEMGLVHTSEDVPSSRNSPTRFSGGET